MADYEEKIERGLKLYLKEVHKVKEEIVRANFGETNVPDRDSGCDTCGYGSDEISFDINFMTAGQRYTTWVTVDGEPLDFFNVLLPYIDRAN